MSDINQEQQDDTDQVSSVEAKIANAVATVNRSNLSSSAKDYVNTLLMGPINPSFQAPPVQTVRQSSNYNGRNGIDLSKLVKKPKTFDGSNDKARFWFEDYETACELNKWTEDDMVYYFPAYLEGSALRWYKWYIKTPCKNAGKTITWPYITRCFNKNYFSVMNKAKIGQQIDSKVQKPEEAVNAFIADMRALLMTYDSSMPETTQIEKVRERLLPDYQKFIAYNDSQTYEELVELCVKLEVGIAKSKTRGKNIQTIVEQRFNKQTKPNDNSKRNFDRNKFQPSPSKVDSAKRCERCERIGHVKSECFAKTKGDKTSLADKAPCEALPRREKPKGETSSSGSGEIVRLKHVSTIVGSIEPNDNSFIQMPTVINGKPINSMVDYCQPQ